MKIMVNKIDVISVLLLNIFCVCILFTGCKENSDSKSSKNENHQQQRESSFDAYVKEMTEKHNAFSYKAKEISASDLFTPIYTYDVEELLIRKDNRPIFFSGSVFDLIKQDEVHIIMFRSYFGSLGYGLDVIFRLVCTPEQFEYVRERAKNDTIFTLDNFAGIARVSEVKRLLLKMSAVPDEYSDSILLNDSISKTFIAEGECIEVIYANDDKFDSLKNSMKNINDGYDSTLK